MNNNNNDNNNNINNSDYYYDGNAIIDASNKILCVSNQKFNSYH